MSFQFLQFTRRGKCFFKMRVFACLMPVVVNGVKDVYNHVHVHVSTVTAKKCSTHTGTKFVQVCALVLHTHAHNNGYACHSACVAIFLSGSKHIN